MRLALIGIACATALAGCAPPDQSEKLLKIAEDQLAAQGYDPGPQDGVWDAQSTAALQSYTTDWGLPPGGRLTWVHYVRLTRLSAVTRAQWRPTDADCAVWDAAPRPQARVTWTGACTDGRATGDGTLEYSYLFQGAPFTRSYQGMMADGKRHGRGRVTWSDGDSYDGDWIEDTRTGKGVYSWTDGARYEGDWLDDDRQGRGRMTWADGESYDGDWAGDLRSGRGVYVWPDGDRYEGAWDGDDRSGRGINTWADGKKYDGDWALGKRTGRGVMTWPDGDRYEGDWRDNQRHGRGVMTWADGEHHEGEWREDRRAGLGTATMADGSRYEGAWSEGDWTSGTFTAANGERYDGLYRHRLRHGRGRMVWPNGDVYDGRWRDDLPDGTGSATVGGVTIRGHWQAGCLDRGEHRAPLALGGVVCPGG